jgi:hypothetical protein
MPFSIWLFPSLNKDVVRDCVPGIVNANKKKQHCRGAKDEKGWPHTGESHQTRSNQHRVCCKWKHDME